MAGRRGVAPEIRVINLEPTLNTIEFELYNASIGFANALRRAMIAEVPTFAVEDCEFAQNTSPLPDEFIAHRIGLCPLYSEDIDKFKFRQECNCSGGCPLCEICFVINVRCKAEKPFKTITTKHLQQIRNPEYDGRPEFEAAFQAADSVQPVRPPISPGGERVPITILKLGPGQILQVLCKAQKSNGRDHAKWSPCSCSTYRQPAEITLDQRFFEAQTAQWKAEFVAKCPSSVFRVLPSDETIQVADASRCTFCRQCQESLEGPSHDEDKIEITNLPGRFIFTVESTGALKPQTIVSKAFEILRKKLETLLGRIERVPLQ